MKFLGIAALFSGVMRTAALAAASQLAIFEKVPIWSGALPPESNRTSQNSISPPPLRFTPCLAMTNQSYWMGANLSDLEPRRHKTKTKAFSLAVGTLLLSTCPVGHDN